MKKILILIASSAFILTLLNGPAGAVGIGVYGGFSYSEAEFQGIEYSNVFNSAIFYWGGAGLVVDTAVAKKKILNYRLNLGIGQVFQERPSGSYGFDISGIKAELMSTFGFGIVKLSFMRMWLGPQLGIRFSHIEVDQWDLDYDCLLLSGGAVLGFNFNIGNYFTISVDGGFRYNAGLNFATVQHSSQILDYETDFTHGPEGFVNLSVIFRIGDTYGNGKQKQRREREETQTKEEAKTEKKSDKEKISSDEDYWFGD